MCRGAFRFGSGKSPGRLRDPLSDTIQGFAKSRDAHGAWSALQAALSDGERPRASAVSSALFLVAEHVEGSGTSSAKVADFAGIGNLFTSLQQCQFTWDEKCMGGALRIACMGGDTQASLRIAGQLMERGWMRPRSIGRLLDLCVQHPSKSLLSRILDMADHAGCELTDPHFGRVFTATGELVKRGELPKDFGTVLAEHLRVLEDRDMGMTATTAEALLECCAAIGNVTADEAEATLGSLPMALARCSSCGNPLSPFPFDEVARAAMLNDVATKLVDDRCKRPAARQHFRTFVRYLEHHGSRFDVIVDGANLGYRGVSRWGNKTLSEANKSSSPTTTTAESNGPTKSNEARPGPVPPDFPLIESALDSLAEHNLTKPLLLLHQRHLEPQNMPPQNAAIASRWLKEQLVYTTPVGLYDDLCWLHAGVFLNDAARLEGDQQPCLVLTNDLMRDHRFQLMAPKSFARWAQRFRLGYSCVRDHTIEKTKVLLEFPATYAPRTHSVGSHWHVPVMSGSGTVDFWLCLSTKS